MRLLGLLGYPTVASLKTKRDITGLIGLLEDKIRWADHKDAADALGDLGDPRAVKSLIAAFNDSEDESCRAVAGALVKIGSPSVNQLIAALDDKKLRTHAAKALGEIRDKRAVEPLINALQNGSLAHYENLVVIEALGKIGDARAVDPLIHEFTGSTRHEIYQLLPDYDTPDKWPEKLVKHGKETREIIEKALNNIGPSGIDSLILACNNKDPETRTLAIQRLAIFGDARAVEPMINAFKDSDSDVVKEAIYAFSNDVIRAAGGTRAVEPLITKLKYSNRLVRSGAARALGKIGDVRAVEPLIAAMNKEKDDWVYPDIIKALVKIGDARAIEPLTALLDDKDTNIQSEARRALKKFEDIQYSRYR